MSKIILCTGGARSGKSEFAERLITAKKGNYVYVATGQAFDDEMRDRIVRHRKRRGTQWKTFEVPTDLPAVWSKILHSGERILVDCLTMYCTNAMLAAGDLETQEDYNRLEAQVLQDIKQVLTATKAVNDCTVVFVTNELGLGVVPENRLARLFRDLAGKVNQTVAEEADHVYMTFSGISIDIKALEVDVNG